MTGLWAASFIAGSAVGLGIAVLLYLISVPDRPALVALLDRASSRPELASLTVEADPIKVSSVWAKALLGRLSVFLDRSWMPVPAKDLAVMEKSRQRFVLERAGLAVFGLLVVPLMDVALWAVGAPLPPALPAVVSIAIAGVLAWLAGAQVRTAAATRRHEMMHALVAYITVVALNRASGEGAAASLELAANTSQSWSFRRIDRQVSAALRAQRTAWQGLQELADELEIEQLGDLSAIVETGGVMGAQIGATLLAKAQSLRRELLAKEQEQAAVATNRMTFPKVALGFVVVLFVLFPPLWTLLTGPVL